MHIINQAETLYKYYEQLPPEEQNKFKKKISMTYKKGWDDAEEEYDVAQTIDLDE